MKKFDKKYEILSAYIDNELSESEIKKVEEKLAFSKEWKEALAELKRMKQLTAKSVKSIPENPYFETKLAVTMRTGKPWYVRARKFMPAAGLVMATAILMIFLKFNPNIINSLVEQQKSNITDFYKQNLKPLLYAADLSNEDIFNFAFYHQLPLDKQKKQYLQLGSDPGGKPYFEIKKASLPEGNNIEKFADDLHLNVKQREQVDSILASYADEMKSQVLINDKNTLAINKNLWNYNKALVADLLTFAEKANSKEFKRVVPSGFDPNDSRSVERLVKAVKASNDPSYIFLTPDTIFTGQYKFDLKKFSEDMAKMKKDLRKNLREMDRANREMDVAINFRHGLGKWNDSSSNNHFSVYIDSNICRVHLPKIIIPNIQLPGNFDSITVNIERAVRQFNRFSFNIPNMSKKGNNSYKYFYSDSSKNYKINMKAFGFDSVYHFGNSKVDSMLSEHLKNFGRMGTGPGSMQSFLHNFFGDSTAFGGRTDIQKQMRQFRKQMEQFQKEMENLKKQLHKERKPREERKSPVEI